MLVAAEPTLTADDTPAVSIIIPTCGRPQMLLDCVASILRNDFQDFEIIIVDQDRERTLQAELARRFDGDGRLVYLVLDEASASRARNLGIRHARGQILVFSDDDTEVDPDWLRAYIEAFGACGDEQVMVTGRLDPMWLVPRPRWLPEGKEYLLGIYNKQDGLMPMPEHEQIISANFAAYRKAVEAIGCFDERLGYSYARKRSMIGGEDSLLSLRARQAHYRLYHQAAARSRHKISAYKLRKAYFVRRSFWEGVTLLTVLHLAGTISADRWHRVVGWHAREIVRLGRRLAGTLVRWPRAANPAQDAMEAVCSIAQSAGVIRAALKLRATGRLPW
jgi:glycosyltransferase involved in cell wall biosynthesis